MISTVEIERVAQKLKVNHNVITTYNVSHRDLMRDLQHIPYFYTNQHTDTNIKYAFLSQCDDILNPTGFYPVQEPPDVHVRILSEHPGNKQWCIGAVGITKELYEILRNTICNVKRASLRKKLIALKKQYNLQYALIRSHRVYIKPLGSNGVKVNFEGYKKFIK